MPEFSLELLQAINDWQSGGDHKQKIRRGEALKAAARDLPAEFRRPPSVCYRQEAQEKDRVWQLLAENKLPETIAAWTSSLDVARDIKGGIPPAPLKGVIFRFAPQHEQVIVNLEALYAEPTFREAIKAHKIGIKRYWNGIGKYQNQQREVVLELGSLDTATVHIYGGYSGTLDQLIGAFVEVHGVAPNAEQVKELTEKVAKPYWLSAAGTRAVLERVLGKADAVRWWGRK
jgi:hypothetical protein